MDNMTQNRRATTIRGERDTSNASIERASEELGVPPRAFEMGGEIVARRIHEANDVGSSRVGKVTQSY